MKRPGRLRIGGQLATPDGKRAFNERLFLEVAPKYDLITRVLSLGRDAAWKRNLLRDLPATAAPVCLDLACGTGDVVFMLAGRYPRGRVVGLDITSAMLERASRRGAAPHVSFVRQDMGQLGIATASVDIVTGSYALRNAPDLGVTLAEIRRVLKPGGTAAFLDFSKPAGAVWPRLEYGLLKGWMGLWGLLLHGNPDVYGYIAESLRGFPDRESLRGLLDRHGFQVVGSRRYFGGIMEALVLKRL